MRGVFVCVGVEPNANAACQLSGLKVHDAPPLPWGEGWGEGLGSLVDTMGPDTPHPSLARRPLPMGEVLGRCFLRGSPSRVPIPRRHPFQRPRLRIPRDALPLPWGEGWGEGVGSLVDTVGPDTPHPARCADLSPWERFRAGVFFVAAHQGSAFRKNTRFNGHASAPSAMRSLSRGERVGVRGWDLSAKLHGCAPSPPG